jgi:hypothetical protein
MQHPLRRAGLESPSRIGQFNTGFDSSEATMKRLSSLLLTLFAFLVSAAWLPAQTTAPPPKLNRLFVHFPRNPSAPQTPLRSATQDNVAAVGLASLPAQSQTTNTTDLVRGIRTDIDHLNLLGSAPGLDPNSSIHTHVQSVSYGKPVEIVRVEDGLDYFEVTGTITGIGWGGTTEDMVNLTYGDNFSPYSYQAPFVLRYTKGFDGTLVAYNLSWWGFSDAVFLEDMFGPQGDDLRHAEREGDLFVSDAALSPPRNHAYFAISSLIRADGSPVAVALSGPNQGQPVIAIDDVPLGRDTTQVAQRLLARLTGRAVTLTIGTGFSAGSLRAVMTSMGYNQNWNLTGSYRTGDVYRKAYDQTSGKIFDGFVPYAWACFDDVTCRTNPENPMGSPMTFVSGEADFAFGSLMLHNAAVLQRAGADVANSVRVYQIRNMSHNPPEAILVFPHIRAALEGPPYPPNPYGWSSLGMSVTSGDWLKPVMARVIDNMIAHLKWGQQLPPSLIDGTIVAGSPPYVEYPQFSRLPGSPLSNLYAQVFPFVDDPSLDSVDSTVTQYSTATEADWGWSLVDDMNDLRSAMPNREQSLILPLTACRQGGYDIIGYAFFLGFPGPFPDMKKVWGSLYHYEDCVQRTIDHAVDLGVYDEEIGEQVAKRTSPAALFK